MAKPSPATLSLGVPYVISLIIIPLITIVQSAGFNSLTLVHYLLFLHIMVYLTAIVMLFMLLVTLVYRLSLSYTNAPSLSKSVHTSCANSSPRPITRRYSTEPKPAILFTRGMSTSAPVLKEFPPK